ncbi:MAG: hypothetical protein O7C67_10600 [Gammaproteobacteria bacterium]|nr:hypothetical protein [Gammaproteobacteria bacterium]
MSVLIYLLSLPLAVSTWAVLLSMRDDVPAPEIILRLAWRASLVTLLTWLADGYQPVVWALATVVALHSASFWGFRWLLIYRR